MEENVSNSKFIAAAIVLISIVGLSGFLIGLGFNQGECPKCSDKKIVKVFTTNNNVEDNVDYNMVTSTIKKELVGKYINKADSKTYLEITKDGSFALSMYNEVKKEYIKYTNEEYVLLFYYDLEEILTEKEIATPTLEQIESKLSYKTTLYFVPKAEIEGDLISNILTFTDIENTTDGISDVFVGPEANSSKIYIKK